ncbi:MAG: trypsin-like peptidase domain-containing protein [Ruminococcaceae bacterium]|nr:trypsin-like peptidase domain-containing protein [Oscillospiraceae bacterium]
MKKFLMFFSMLLFALIFIGCKEKQQEHFHTFGDWVVVSYETCTEKGIQEHFCSCGKSEIKNIDALGHTEIIDPAVPATCTTDGKTEGKHCLTCSEILSHQKKVPACHTDGEWITDSYPTCTKSGSKHQICLICKETIRISEIDALGHTEVVDPAVVATCTTDGKTEGKHCSVCNETLLPQTIVLKTGHIKVIDSEVLPTCYKDGKTEGSHCSICNVIFVPQKVVPARHNESRWIVDIEPTMNSVGKKHTECLMCGVTINIEIIPKLGLTKEEIKSKLKASIVKVICYDYDGKTEISQGSGIFIDNKGTFITNAHVIEDCYYIKIKNYLGATYDVDTICKYNGTTSDYAICKTQNFYLSQPVEFSASANVDDVVYALGYPNDSFIMSITSGKITSTDVIDSTKHFYKNTAWIDHGSSGGALVDSQGRVLGITTGILADGEYAALKYQDFKLAAEGSHVNGVEPLYYFHKVNKYDFSSFSMSNYFEIYVDVLSRTDTSVYYRVGVRLKDRYRDAKFILSGSATISIKLETTYDYYESRSYGGTYHQTKTTNDTKYLYYYSEKDLIYGKSASSNSSIFVSSINDYYNMKISYEADFGILQSGTIMFFE